MTAPRVRGPVAQQLVIVGWRLTCTATILGAWTPVMAVGRRPYTISRLADRLAAIGDMELTPPWLPTALRLFFAALVVTAVTGALTPVRWRRLQATVPLTALALAAASRRAAENSEWLSATGRLDVVIAALTVAVILALVPTTRPGANAA